MSSCTSLILSTSEGSEPFEDCSALKRPFSERCRFVMARLRLAKEPSVEEEEMEEVSPTGIRERFGSLFNSSCVS